MQAFETRNDVFLVMEYVEYGSLEDLIQETNIVDKDIKDEDISNILKHLLKGVEHIHANQIIHRDLKPGKKLL